jgi:DNA polymerase-1
LIQQYDSLDNLYRHVSEIKGKRGEDLQKFKEQAYLSKRLATLHEDVPLNLMYEECRKSPFNEEKCRALFEELEFHRLLEEFGGGKTKTLATEAYHLVVEEKDFTSFLERLKTAKRFAFDTETTSLDPLKARLVGLSFALEPGEAYYVPVGHRTDEKQLELPKVLDALRPLLEDPGREKIGQHVKYDTHVLRNHGVEVQGARFDTMIASYLLDPAMSHKLDSLAARLLNHKMISYEEVAGKQGDFSMVSLEKATAYSGEDADATLRIFEIFQEKLKAEGLETLFAEVEMPLTEVLLKMERRGIKLDRAFLTNLQKEFGDRILRQEEKVRQLAGGDFNLQSPKQLAVILFEKLNLPVMRKTKTGYSTDVDVLTELSKLHDLPKEILEHRSLTKLKSTYVDALLNIADPETDRVHTSFNQTIAETGRLSSSDPNLQNIPIRSEDGAKIRRAFIAEAGFELMSADYSQIELRVLAHLSEDPLLLEAFAKNLDVHRITAASIFGVSEALVTSAMRGAGKTVNFAVIYGQTPFGLSQQLNVPQQQAKKYIEQYFQKYAGVKAYRDRILEEARAKKEVRTLMGRRRFVPEIDSKNTMARNFAERIAFNTVVQGTAADIIKKAMVELDREMTKQKLRSHMLLQVHDELVFEAEKSEKAALSKLIREKMGGAVKFRVPLSVEVGEGANWAEAHG